MKLISEYGGLQSLNELDIVTGDGAILLVTGKQSYELSGANKIIEQWARNRQTVRFSEFSINPKIEDAIRGAELARRHKIQAIVAIGGGSVLDMAKLIKTFFHSPGDEYGLARGKQTLSDPDLPLVAIPTTAGSGSEATHFAVVYIGAEKYSLASKFLLPDAVILDGKLVQSGSKYQKTCNALDALAQGIESFWACGSTNESRNHSTRALSGIWDLINSYVHSNCTDQTSQKMLEAAHFAGKAINISKTTAAHAWSYALTGGYGIPHGHAVWMTLPSIFRAHYNAPMDQVIDPRGFEHHTEIMQSLCTILDLDPTKDLEELLKQRLHDLEIASDFSSFGIVTKRDRQAICENVNMERMNNNPIKLDAEIHRIFKL